MRMPETLKFESMAVANIEKRSLANLIETLLGDAVEQKKATDPRRFRVELEKVLEHGARPIEPKRRGVPATTLKIKATKTEEERKAG